MRIWVMVLVACVGTSGCGNKAGESAEKEPADKPAGDQTGSEDTKAPPEKAPRANTKAYYADDIAAQFDLPRVAKGHLAHAGATEFSYVAVRADSVTVGRLDDAPPGKRVKLDELEAWMFERKKLQGSDGRNVPSPNRTQERDDRFFRGETWTRALGPARYGPLVFADKSLPASRLVQVVSALCQHGAYIALMREGYEHTLAHWVGLGTLDDKLRCETEGGSGFGGHGSFRGGVAIYATADALTAVVKDEEHPLGAYADPKAAADKLLGLLEKRGKYRVYLALDPDLPLDGVIRVLDVFYAAKMFQVHLGASFEVAKRAAHERDHPQDLTFGAKPKPAK